MEVEEIPSKITVGILHTGIKSLPKTVYGYTVDSVKKSYKNVIHLYSAFQISNQRRSDNVLTRT